MGPMGPKCLLGPFKALWAHGAKCPQGPSRPYGPYGPMGPHGAQVPFKGLLGIVIYYFKRIMKLTYYNM